MSDTTESSEWCEMVPDGTDVNGDQWNRCIVHGYMVLGDAYVCEGYLSPTVEYHPLPSGAGLIPLPGDQPNERDLEENES